MSSPSSPPPKTAHSPRQRPRLPSPVRSLFIAHPGPGQSQDQQTYHKACHTRPPSFQSGTAPYRSARLGSAPQNGCHAPTPPRPHAPGNVPASCNKHGAGCVGRNAGPSLLRRQRQRRRFGSAGRAAMWYPQPVRATSFQRSPRRRTRPPATLPPACPGVVARDLANRVASVKYAAGGVWGL